MKPHEEQHETIKKWILDQLAEAFPTGDLNENNWFEFIYKDVQVSLEADCHRFSSVLLSPNVKVRLCCRVTRPAYNRVVCTVPTTGDSLQGVFDKIIKLNTRAAAIQSMRSMRKRDEQAANLVHLQHEELPVIPKQFNIHREADGRYSVTFFSFLTLEQTRALIAATQGIMEQP